MNFQVSELTQQVAYSARDFAQQHIRPHVMTWDESQEFPIALFKELGKLGMMGVFVPHEYGGAGLGYFEYKAVIEEIAKVCGSIGLSLAAHNSLCTGHILAFANEEQKNKYLPRKKFRNSLYFYKHIFAIALPRFLQKMRMGFVVKGYRSHISKIKKLYD